MHDSNAFFQACSSIDNQRIQLLREKKIHDLIMSLNLHIKTFSDIIESFSAKVNSDSDL